MPAMGTGLPEHDGTCNDATIAYYRRRAEGGVGMITIEASLVSPDAYGVGPELRLHGEEFVPGLRGLVDALRPSGIPIGIQLWHPGRQTLLGEPIAPSPIAALLRTPVPHELTLEEIHTLVDYYALSAWVSQQAGFDFVEIHGAPLLPPVRVHLAALEPPHRRVRRPAREPRALPARDRRRDPRPLRRRLPGHVPHQRGRGRRGRLRGRGRRRGLPPARGRRRLRDQRLGGQLVRAPPDDRADVPPARLPASRSPSGSARPSTSP